MMNLSDARAIADRVDVFAGEGCSVAEISEFMSIAERDVTAAIWLGPSEQQFRKQRRLATGNTKPRKKA